MLNLRDKLYTQVRRYKRVGYCKYFNYKPTNISGKKFCKDISNSITCGIMSSILKSLFKGKSITHKKVFDEIYIKKLLDDKYKIVLYHDYDDGYETYKKTPKSQRYPNHIFTLLKYNNKYYIVQAYMNKYDFSFKEIKDICTFLLDINKAFNKSKDKYITEYHDHLYNKYFNTNLLSESGKSLIGIKMPVFKLVIRDVYK
jgi:hypothetical protein